MFENEKNPPQLNKVKVCKRDIFNIYQFIIDVCAESEIDKVFSYENHSYRKNRDLYNRKQRILKLFEDYLCQ